MTDRGDGENPGADIPEEPLDQTTAPTSELQEGNSEPLDQTEAEMQAFHGSADVDGVERVPLGGDAGGHDSAPLDGDSSGDGRDPARRSPGLS